MTTENEKWFDELISAVKSDDALSDITFINAHGSAKVQNPITGYMATVEIGNVKWRTVDSEGREETPMLYDFEIIVYANVKNGGRNLTEKVISLSRAIEKNCGAALEKSLRISPVSFDSQAGAIFRKITVGVGFYEDPDEPQEPEEPEEIVYLDIRVNGETAESVILFEVKTETDGYDIKEFLEKTAFKTINEETKFDIKVETENTPLPIGLSGFSISKFYKNEESIYENCIRDSVKEKVSQNGTTTFIYQITSKERVVRHHESNDI